MQLLFPVAPANKLVRRGSKLAGNSLSSQFQEQLNFLMQTLNDSVPRYVRCIKPNSQASADPADIDETAVKE